MNALYTGLSQSPRENGQGGGCLAALSLVVAIIIEATVLCAAAGGLWPLMVWALMTCAFIHLRA